MTDVALRAMDQRSATLEAWIRQLPGKAAFRVELSALRRRREQAARGRPARARGKRQSVESQIAEMAALERTQRERVLTHEESERLGVLVHREAERSRAAGGRGKRINALRAELAMLETLEIAERGPVAEGCADGDPVELVQRSGGDWATEARAA